MTLFARRFQWPTGPIVFHAISDGARDGTAEVIEKADRWILKSPGNFSGASGQPGVRLVGTLLDSSPALIQGSVFAIDGDLGLRVDEVRVGSADPSAQYTEVTATFEHLSSALSYRREDGAARNLALPLLLPEIDEAPQMEATLSHGAGTITLVAPEPIPLEYFEAQLAAFQSILTFATDLPCARLSLIAIDEFGRPVEVYGRDKYSPFERAERKSIEHSMRFIGQWAQGAIDRWWTVYSDWKPVAQIIAGLRYQPGYVDADVVLSSAAIESVATALQQRDAPSLSPEEALPIIGVLNSLTGLRRSQREAVSRLKGELKRTTFRSKVEQLLQQVDADVWTQARLSTEEWTKQFLNARNKIAHAASDGPWDDSALLRAIRDANWVVLTLVLLTHMDVPSAAISRAAERLGARYAIRHRATKVFV